MFSLFYDLLFHVWFLFFKQIFCPLRFTSVPVIPQEMGYKNDFKKALQERAEATKSKSL